MENNKYYTPTIEEFHVGFEFLVPIYGSDKFVEETFSLNSIRNLFDKDTNENYKLPDVFKVKHLDREDVESLGWKFKEVEEGMLSNRPIFEFKTYSLNFDRNEHGTWILITDEDCDYQHFSGKVANKSELKRLMQQLNILK